MQSVVNSVHKGVDRVTDVVNRTWEYKNAHPHAFAAAIIASSLLGKLVIKLAQRYVKSNTILELTFDSSREFTELIDPSEEWFSQHKMEFRKFVETLQVAAKDKRVIGIIARISSLPVGLDASHVEELGQVLRQCKANGKMTFAIYEGDYGSNSLGTYFLASYFDKIYLPECCGLNLIGIRSDTPFLKNMLTKIGIEPEIGKRKEYKNAANLFLEEKFTEAHREATVALTDGFFEQIATEIAKNRGWDLPTTKKILTEGPYFPQRALELRLVDKISYPEELYENLESLFGTKKTNLLFAEKYAKKVAHLRPYSSGKPWVGLITLDGNVYSGNNGGISSDPVVAAIRAAREDKKLKAVVIRINSGGGSYVGSDLIAREVKKLAETKKVVISMSTYAASGGYYIAMNGHKILAAPLTLTGSIGVFYGKLVMRELWNKLGITFDDYQIGDKATFTNSLVKYTEEEKKVMNDTLDFIYNDFTSKVAAARNMSREEVEVVARGRVWTGNQAKDAKIIDKVGYLNDAIDIAKELGNIPKETKIKLQIYPKPVSIVKQIFNPPNNSRQTAVGIMAAPSASLWGTFTNMIFVSRRLGTFMGLLNYVTRSSMFSGQQIQCDGNGISVAPSLSSGMELPSI
jgi:protease-4